MLMRGLSMEQMLRWGKRVRRRGAGRERACDMRGKDPIRGRCVLDWDARGRGGSGVG
ncbi:MAG: hypothetical protein Kow0022_03490 [Phycisphaerales bacterium]